MADDKKYTASQWAKIYGGHDIDDNNDNSLQLVHELTESRLFRNKKIASEVNLDDAAEISFMYLMLLNIFNKDYDLIMEKKMGKLWWVFPILPHIILTHKTSDNFINNVKKHSFRRYHKYPWERTSSFN